MWYAYAIGYGYALFAGLLTARVVNSMWKLIGWKANDNEGIRRNIWEPVSVGIIERTLYVSSLILGHGVFIGFWLALKVAGRWTTPWEESTGSKKVWPVTRSAYQIFLVGSGISVLYAFVGFKLIMQIENGEFAYGFLLSVVLVAANEMLKFWLDQCKKSG